MTKSLGSLLICLFFFRVPAIAKNHPVDRDSTIQFQLLDQKICVPVVVNGRGPYEFLLYTGTRTSMIDLQLAQELELRSVARRPLATVTGIREIHVARVASLALGAKTIAGLEVLWLDLGMTFQLDRRIRGVLGQNFLSRTNCLLDYRHRTREFEENGELQSRLAGPSANVTVFINRGT